MKYVLSILMLLGSLLQLSLAQAAPAATQPSVRLSLFKVTSLGGKEQLQSAANVSPGDVVEYQALYSNETPNPAKDVQVTLPVPAGGLEVMPDWRGPQAVMASTDGKVFEAVPLMRNTRLADGSIAKRPVPAAEYRFLRWPLGDLPAGATRTVSARMQLPALSTSVANASPSSSAQPSAR